MQTEEGKNVWIFPDGELPVPDKKSKLEAHEALMILNTSSSNAKIKLTFYFSDKDPIKNIPLKIESQRVRCIRIGHPEEIGEVKIPYSTQYALKVESNIKVVATFGRLDTTSEKMAFYTGGWFCY